MISHYKHAYEIIHTSTSKNEIRKGIAMMDEILNEGEFYDSQDILLSIAYGYYRLQATRQFTRVIACMSKSPKIMKLKYQFNTNIKNNEQKWWTFNNVSRITTLLVVLGISSIVLKR